MIVHDKCTAFEARIAELEEIVKFLKETLRDIANEDFRGNKSSGSVKAYQALQKLESTTNE